MKILMLTQFISMGGLERMIYLLSKELKRAHDLDLIVYSYDTPEDQPSFKPLLNQEGIRVYLRPKKQGFSFRTVLRLARLLRQEQIEILHTHDLGALVYGALAKYVAFSHVKLVHTQHSFIHITKGWVYPVCEKIFTRLANQVVVVDDGLKANYEELDIPTRNILTIYNGVIFPTARADADQKSAAKQRLRKVIELAASGEKMQRTELGPESRPEFWMVSLARIHPRKGQDQLLKVWAALPQRVRDRSRLFFVGPETLPGTLSKLRELISQSPDADRIHCPGSTQTPELWLEAADLYLSGSEYEGMPLGPIEAIGAGLPTVLSDIAGHQRLAAHSELYPLEQPEKGATIVATILDRLGASREEADAFLAQRWEETQAIRDRYSAREMANHYFRKAYGT